MAKENDAAIQAEGKPQAEAKASPVSAPKATTAPYASHDGLLPQSLAEALEILNNDTAFRTEFGNDFIRYFTRIKTSEVTRYEMAEDKGDWQRREYFSRI